MAVLQVPHMKQEHESLKEMMLDAVDVLTATNKPFWFSAGTLLGFVRNGGFIEWEDDIDIDMWKKEDDLVFKKRLARDFQKIGYSVYFSDAHMNVRPKNSEYKIYLDINFFEKKGATVSTPRYYSNKSASAPWLRFLSRFLFVCAQRLVWCCYDLNNCRLGNTTKITVGPTLLSLPPAFLFHLLPVSSRERMLPWISRLQNAPFSTDRAITYPAHFFSALRDIEIFGEKMPIPKESEAYLEYKYGADWMKPAKEWDTMKQDRSLCGPGETPASTS